jgi:hypothetical protein
MGHILSRQRQADIRKLLGILGATFILGAMFIGCDNGVVPPDPEIPDEIHGAIWPLDVGNEWTFDVQSWDDSIADWIYYGERYIVDTAFMHNEKRVAKVRLEYFFGDTVFQEFSLWWGNTHTGLYEYAPFGDGFVPYAESRMLFKYPSIDGELFSSYAPNPVNPVSMGFMAEMPPIEVPAGNFENCVGYQYYEPPGENIYYYFVPDTGYIQMERYIGSTLNKARFLNSYVLN